MDWSFVYLLEMLGTAAFAATGAIRLEGISTPVPRRIREVCTAAAAIATKGSAQSIWVS